MASNTPRKPKSLALNTLLTPNNPSLTPSGVRCVTQTQETDPFSNTPDYGADHQHILNSLCAAEHADNTPQWQSPRAQLAVTPVLSSPDRAAILSNVAAQLFKVNSRGKRLKATARNSGAMKAQKKSAYLDPSKNLLWFLCEKHVDNYADKLQGKTLSTAQKFKPAYQFWRNNTNAKRKRNALAPFDDMLKELLTNGWPLSRSYHRLLIEDFMLLEQDAPLVAFIHKTHPLIKSSTWKKQLKEVMTVNPYEPLNLQSSYYFVFQMIVLRNIYRDNISKGIFTKIELLYNCTMRYGHGLTMELLNGHQQLITFHDVMTNFNSLPLYSCNLPSHIPQIKKVLSNIRDIKRIGPAASHLLDESYGDSEKYISVLNGHDSKLNTTLRAAEDKAMEEANLLTSWVIKSFTLSNNDAAFVKVRAKIDSVMVTSVEEVYGKFSELTTPILTQVRNLLFITIAITFQYDGNLLNSTLLQKEKIIPSI